MEQYTRHYAGNNILCTERANFVEASTWSDGSMPGSLSNNERKIDSKDDRCPPEYHSLHSEANRHGMDEAFSDNSDNEREEASTDAFFDDGSYLFGANGSYLDYDREAPVLNKGLPCTLEEIFAGARKRVTIKDRPRDRKTSRLYTKVEIVEVLVERGFETGATIVVPLRVIDRHRILFTLEEVTSLYSTRNAADYTKAYAEAAPAIQKGW